MNIFNFLFFLIYRFLFIPLGLTLIFLVGWPFNKKIKQGLQLRKDTSFKGVPPDSTIWIHASSGEFEYAKSVIRNLKEANPSVFVLVTYFSPSYAKQIKSFQGVDFAMPLPFDTPSAVSSFLNKFKPKALLVARTDVWPELLYQTHKRKIPALLFSTTFKPLTGFRLLLKPYYKMLFDFFADIYAVSADDKFQILQTHTKTSVHVFGDTRYDQVLFRKEHPKDLKLNLLEKGNSPILIAGSTWPEDEKVLLPAVKDQLLDNKLRLILAPHEPTPQRISDIINQLQSMNIKSDLYTKSDNFNSPVLIIDCVGILADLYTHGDIAFVGGSFKNKIHSVMEPLCAGLPTLVGPLHTNNREATQFQKIIISDTLTAVTLVQNTSEIKNHLSQFLLSLHTLSNSKKLIQKEVHSRALATDKVITWLKHIEHPETIKRGSLNEQISADT